MNGTNRTLETAERLIRERFPGHFGDSYRIDRIEGSSFDRKDPRGQLHHGLPRAWQSTAGPPEN